MFDNYSGMTVSMRKFAKFGMQYEFRVNLDSASLSDGSLLLCSVSLGLK